MSLKDKASKIDFGSLPGVLPSATTDTPGSTARPKTAPGLMMAHAADQRSELVRENETLKAKVAELGDAAARAAELQDELKSWDGAKATRLLDPKLVTWSPWANRDPANFSGQDFLELKSEIASAGGNVQPIKVRAAKPGGEFEYEIVFGHRRHRACLELGLPVLAVVDNLGEVELFVQMDRENRSRKNLSAWEQGMMYQRALEKGLFPSNRKLAEQVGVDLAQVGKALALAKLPKEVINAFASPLDLQFRWAKPLTDLNESDPAALIARAQRAKTLGPNRSAKEVLDALLSDEGQGGGTVLPPPIEVSRDGKPAARIELDAKGRATVSFAAAVVSPGQMKALGEAIEAFLVKASKLKK
ncbi:MAG: ParB/RepB/Spo0J family partition protein [Burkholderiales bacterium]|nr:ParB/RepB/Spo0J family partition protein [Burkholderiales bacterium]